MIGIVRAIRLRTIFILVFVPVPNTTRNRQATQGSAYEDVDVNNAEPVIHPKPEPASSGDTMGRKNTEYAVVSKARPGAAAAPTNGSENRVYASVDKSKKSSARTVQTAKEFSDHPPLPGADIKPEVKPKPTKPVKAEKPKKNKGKAKERGKKGNYMLIICNKYITRHRQSDISWGLCLRCTVLGEKQN